MVSPSIADEPTIVVQADGSISHMNEAARALLGVESSEAVVNTSISEYVVASYHKLLDDQFHRIVRGDTPAIGLTIEITTPNGGSRELVVLNSSAEWDGDERIRMLFFETEGLLPTGLSARTMDASPIGISIADASRADEPIIYVNDGFGELTGYAREEVLGRNCRFLQGPETSEEAVREIRGAIDAEAPITTELRNYRKDGSLFWNRLSITPIEGEDGTVTHFLGFQEDVSDRKLFEREKALFEMQAAATDQSISITDVDGTIVYVNSAFERTTGYSSEEAMGENPRLLKSNQQDEAFYRELWETITAGDVWESELTNRRKSGELYRTTQKIVPVTNPEGKITHFIAIEEDITDAQFIEQVLHVMDRVLRHNVRNSVTAISGFAELLESELDEEEHRAAVRTIREHAEKLGRLSDETRTIRELFRRRHAQHSLSIGAISGFVDKRREIHPDAVIDLSIDVEEDVVVQNGSLLQLAIDEALENAIVHTDRAEPHVEVRVRQVENGTELCIDIADDGPGLPDDQWAVIMTGEETPLSHSTGIGLWLIYWTVTALGGAIDRAGNEPRGTVLTYRVPLVSEELVEGWNASS